MIQVFQWILFDIVFYFFFIFLEENDIKVGQNYIFSFIFNRCEL